MSINCSIVSFADFALFCAVAEATKINVIANMTPIALFHLHITPPKYANPKLNSRHETGG